ncbi:Uncharacterized protein TCM_014062 [Theobroma cacao]|uniref:Uncharacterized protein n=1 Tax=Theobroma cacao TaxID=3641 RepID=A0A061FX97_THECC|nr:Uncharacterized protein TCM_014062 [Theobroma cacao]
MILDSIRFVWLYLDIKPAYEASKQKPSCILFKYKAALDLYLRMLRKAGKAGQPTLIVLGLHSRAMRMRPWGTRWYSFLGSLCACSHGRMIDERSRQENLDTMSKREHSEPAIKHCGITVDMMG